MTTPQRPIGSGFGAESTAEEVLHGIDLTGRTALVTGGYSGIGLETTRALGRVVWISAGSRALARTLAALSAHPSRPTTRVSLRLAIARTGPRALIRADPNDTA
jgi:NAD(P)-dependent dehydrogenase (short-subunit alcohol dehydrogenase family)